MHQLDLKREQMKLIQQMVSILKFIFLIKLVQCVHTYILLIVTHTLD